MSSDLSNQSNLFSSFDSLKKYICDKTVINTKIYKVLEKKNISQDFEQIYPEKDKYCKNMREAATVFYKRMREKEIIWNKPDVDLVIVEEEVKISCLGNGQIKETLKKYILESNFIDD